MELILSVWILGDGEKQGAHPPGTAFAAVSDSHLGCLMALLLGCSHPLQRGITAGFAGLLGWVLGEMEEGF